eukprot:766139-Hanusia_phi.AAC.2
MTCLVPGMVVPGLSRYNRLCGDATTSSCSHPRLLPLPSLVMSLLTACLASSAHPSSPTSSLSSLCLSYPSPSSAYLTPLLPLLISSLSFLCLPHPSPSSPNLLPLLIFPLTPPPQILVCFAVLFNNLSKDRRYPLYW